MHPRATSIEAPFVAATSDDGKLTLDIKELGLSGSTTSGQLALAPEGDALHGREPDPEAEDDLSKVSLRPQAAAHFGVDEIPPQNVESLGVFTAWKIRELTLLD